MALTIGTLRKNAMLDSLADLANGGFLRIYGGTRPATPDTALNNNPLLCEMAFGNPAFDPATGGTKTAKAIGAGTGTAAAGMGGTLATFFRAFSSAGVALFDGTAGLTGSDLVLVNATILQNLTVQVASMVITQAG